MPRITAKLRAEAAVLCSAAASLQTDVGYPGTSIWVHTTPLVLWRLVRDLNASHDAEELANLACAAALEVIPRIEGTWGGLVQRMRFAWAEAHALLECGYVPEGWR